MVSKTTRILMFHRIVPDDPVAFGLPSSYRLRGTALTPGEFEKVLDSEEAIIPLAQVENALAAGTPLPEGVVLTFDDGYREHLDFVLPLLRSRSASGTFYVATDLHGDGAMTAPVDAWYWLLDHAEHPAPAVRLPDGDLFRCRLDTVEEKRTWVEGRPKAALLQAAPKQQWQLIGALENAVRCTLPDDLAAQLYLRPKEWQLLAGAGMRLGAHSRTHPRLTALGDGDLEREVNDSVAVIAELSAPVTFAYPDGDFDERVVAAIRRAGASSAVTCRRGEITSHDALLHLPRVFVTQQPENRPVRSGSKAATSEVALLPVRID